MKSCVQQIQAWHLDDFTAQHYPSIVSYRHPHSSTYRYLEQLSLQTKEIKTAQKQIASQRVENYMQKMTQ